MINRLIVASAVAVLVTGCGPIAIDYRPAPTALPALPPIAHVALMVRNARPEERGGLTARVGTIYDSSWGQPGSAIEYSGRAVNTTSPETITRTVEAATVDALARAGFSTKPAAPMLTVSVNEYWFDGIDVHTTVIKVSYDLIDRTGRSLWHADYRGEGSATFLVGSALVNTFRTALSEVARQASDGFRLPAFQTALRKLP
jgi:hypothetical protein